MHGGVLITEAFSKKQLLYNSGGPKDLDLLYDINDLNEDFKSLSIDILIEKEIVIKEGKYHNGKASIIRLAGRKM